MPELAEVEVVRQGLAERVLGSTWQHLAVYDDRILVTQSRMIEHRDGLKSLEGGRIIDVVRRGKYLWFVVEKQRQLAACVIHLGMSGQLIYRENETGGQPVSVHERARWTLTTAERPDQIQTIGFIDQRMFGWAVWDSFVDTPDGYPAGHGSTAFPALPAWAVDGDLDWATRWYPQIIGDIDAPAVGASSVTAQLPARLQHVARDVLDPYVDLTLIIALHRQRQVSVKTLLLDQTVISGIGNIYAAEALWLARIDPRRLVKRTSAERLHRVYEAAAIVITASLRSGGTTFDQQYRNVNGISGRFFESLMVYGRSGLPCRRCGTTLRSLRQTGRVTVYCPACQH